MDSAGSRPDRRCGMARTSKEPAPKDSTSKPRAAEIRPALLRQEGEAGRDLDYGGREQALTLHAFTGFALLDPFETGTLVRGVLVEEPQIAIDHGHDVGVPELTEDDGLRGSRNPERRSSFGCG